MTLDRLDGVNRTDLRAYYNANPGYVNNCGRNNNTDWWRFTPYNWQETKYWILKMVALPLAATVIFIFIFQIGLGSFNDPIIQFISYILLFIANIFLTSYSREVIRAEMYEITVADGLIDVPVPYDINQEETLFRFNLNPIGPTKFTIGFVGDIMMMRDYDLVFHNDIITFFNDVDIIVGNLEGIVNAGGHTLTTQAHLPTIITQLQSLLRHNTQWLLCLSNNHSIDFGNIELHDSLDLIRDEPNIYVFGRNDVPNVVSHNNPINIATATQWSNQGNWDCISRYENINVNNGFGRIFQNNNINILFPHWGYENERYVRPSIQSHARMLLTGQNQIVQAGGNTNNWDLIFGHHSHVRQPIMKVNDINAGLWRLVVFSGGNLTSGATFIRKRKHIYGTIMKCRIGPLTANPAQLAIGNVEWRRTYNRNEAVNNRRTKTICIDRERYRISNTTSLIIAIILIGSIILVRVLELFFN